MMYIGIGTSISIAVLIHILVSAVILEYTELGSPKHSWLSGLAHLINSYLLS